MGQWKKQVLEQLPEIFSNGKRRRKEDDPALRNRLCQEIAQLEYELNVSYTISSNPTAAPVHYTTSPTFGIKSYALLSFNASTNIEIPDNFALHQNYPNPFNPATTINFDLPEAAKVKLIIYNILGQNVMTLMDATTSAGYKSVNWDASELASGLYIYRIEAESLSGSNKFASVRKMVLTK